MASEPGKPRWTFLSNHSHVLLCIMNDAELRGRDIAAQVGVTERAVSKIIADLMDAGYITRRRVGRRNNYTVHPEVNLRHPLLQHHTVGELLTAIDIAGRTHDLGGSALAPQGRTPPVPVPVLRTTASRASSSSVHPRR